ncbi:MAG TPA: efflux RND transporter periplasmic adaptor subunit [Candidatus Polarisedimenticolaceae bacterium]|nr:efflux RND transporter periplasmic adaptor subunit [Candidatus Polarisedimenticolaceae bacterium]
MSRHVVASALLLLAVLGSGAALAAKKYASIQESAAAAASQPEPMEMISAAEATARDYRGSVTAIGTVLATRSVTLRNELAGTVRQVALVPGAIVPAGTVLVALDVSVEQAELAALKARAVLAETLLERNQQASANHAVSDVEVDRARAERDVALAEMARTEAIIARKTITAPFRARVGLADVHPGQYLAEGTVLTTLQGIDDVAHVDFAVPQRVAAGLHAGDRVEISEGSDGPASLGVVVAVDARVDPTTRNAAVRARIEDVDGPAPGASVRVSVPDGPSRTAVSIPVSALRKGPDGDHVFVVAAGEDGKPRAHVRPVQSGTVLGDEVLIVSGLEAGEKVATSGSFKLRESVLVAVSEPAAGGAAKGGK